jgi:hypothetical protein
VITALPQGPGKQVGLDEPWPDFSVREHGGVPTIHRGGVPWLAACVQKPFLGDEVSVFARLHGAGLRLAQVDATCSEDIYHPHLRYWHGPGQFDGSSQSDYFQKVTAAAPDALLILRLYAGAPEWWTEAHPEECQRDENGSDWFHLQRAGCRRVPSLASRKWKADLNEALASYLRWLESSGWSRKVAGILLSNGITWEWGILGSDVLPDTSEHARRYFEAHLRKLYGKEAALSKSWGREMTWGQVQIPSAAERQMSHPGLRPEPAARQVIDHQQSLSEMNCDLLLSLASTIRREAGSRPLVGTWYGYTLTAREQTAFTGQYGAGGFVGGHHALDRVLASPDIDFLVSPFNYADRTLGKGLLLEHVPLASIHRHGKAFYDENDLWMLPPKGDDRASVISVGVANNRDEAIAYTRSAWGQALVRGKHLWFSELCGWVAEFEEHFSDPVLLAEIKRLNQLGQQLLDRDRTSAAEVAFVIDEKSVAWLPLDHTGFRDHVYMGSVGWGHLGAPFDLILQSDLPACPNYRLVVGACIKSPSAREEFDQWRRAHPGISVLWDNSPDWYPPTPSEILRAYQKAGVHLYTDGGQTVWANRSMVFIHVDEPGTHTVRFREPCRGREIFSGRDFAASSGFTDWGFSDKGSALFVIEPSLPSKQPY